MRTIIRPYRPDSLDRQQIDTICCDAAFLGEPIDPIFQDRDWFAEFMISPYLVLEPEHTWVAEVDDRVVGYLTASMEGLFGLYRSQLAILSVHRLFWNYTLGRYRDHPRSRQFARFVLTEALFQVPQHPPDAAHFHFNMARDYRAQGLGLRLVSTFQQALRAAGIGCYYAEVMCWGAKHESYYARLGYRVYGEPIPTTVFSPEVPDLRIMCIVRDLP